MTLIRLQRRVSVIVLILAGVCSVFCQNAAIRFYSKVNDPVSFAWPPAVLRVGSLGFTQALSDLLWITIVTAYGAPQLTVSDYRRLSGLLDAVTRLDPNWYFPHYFATIVLAQNHETLPQANTIAERWIQHHGGDWRLYFLLGYNAYFLLDQAFDGGKYFALAAQFPEAPHYLRSLAKRLLADRNQKHTIDELSEILNQITDPTLREMILKQIKVER